MLMIEHVYLHGHICSVDVTEVNEHLTMLASCFHH